MANQLITYDLRAPGRDYGELHDAIKSLGKWWHCLESAWIVNTSYTAAQIRDHLRQFIDTNDDLLVVGLDGNWATFGLSDNCNNWLRDNLAH